MIPSETPWITPSDGPFVSYVRFPESEDAMEPIRNLVRFLPCETLCEGGNAIAGLRQVWDEFLETGVVAQRDLRPIIVNSWKRCLNLRSIPTAHPNNSPESSWNSG